MRGSPPDDGCPLRQQRRQLFLDIAARMGAHRVGPGERIVARIRGNAACQTRRSQRTHAHRTIKRAIVRFLGRTGRRTGILHAIDSHAPPNLFVSGPQHDISRMLNPCATFHDEPFNVAVRHARRRGNDDIRIRRLDAQVHVFDRFAHDGHRHAVDFAGFASIWFAGRPPNTGICAGETAFPHAVGLILIVGFPHIVLPIVLYTPAFAARQSLCCDTPMSYMILTFLPSSVLSYFVVQMARQMGP